MIENFAELGLSSELLNSLEKIGYQKPTPIQQQAIPLIIQGKDLIALAHTGSGKTAACALPLCEMIPSEKARNPLALVLVPTRELAMQYATEAQKIGRCKGIKVFALCGGEKPGLQRSKLAHGVHLLIATPGRLIDFIYSRDIDLSSVKTLVLDEADEMLSIGFYDDLEFIMQCLVQKHQTLLFSATMAPSIRKLAHNHMRSPVELTLTKQTGSPDSIDHFFVYCKEEKRNEELMRAICHTTPQQAIVFCSSRIQTEKVAHYLKREFKDVDYLHGGLSQSVRTLLTSKFRSGKLRLLVATDIAARGLDFNHISHVFMLQLPQDPKTYLHRSGRSGRHFRKGVCVALVSQKERRFLKEVEAKLGKKANWLFDEPVFSDHPSPSDRSSARPSNRASGRSSNGPSNRSSAQPSSRCSTRSSAEPSNRPSTRCSSKGSSRSSSPSVRAPSAQPDRNKKNVRQKKQKPSPSI